MGRFAFQLIVTGKVQGVGFRAFTRQIARRFGFNGWVRNLASGQVEIFVELQIESTSLEVAQAKANQIITLFSDQIKTGNSFARVEHISIKSARTEGINSFYINL